MNKREFYGERAISFRYWDRYEEKMYYDTKRRTNKKIPITKCIIMQSTGKKDFYKTLMFEDDIVSLERQIDGIAYVPEPYGEWFIGWDNTIAGFGLWRPTGDFGGKWYNRNYQNPFKLSINQVKIYVLGNIHQGKYQTWKKRKY